jgi:hypothetical protein
MLMNLLAVVPSGIYPLLHGVRLWSPKAASIAATKGQPYATSVSTTTTMVASGVRRLYKGVPLRATKVFWQTSQR